MSFLNLDEIRREFGIEAANPEEVRARLRALQAELHPDRTGGQFASSLAKERFHRIQEAISQVDLAEAPQTAMVPVTAVTELVKAVRDLLPTKQANSADIKLDTSMREALAGLRTRYRAPRLTTSAITVILTALWLFPSQIATHPLLGRYLDASNRWFAVIWLFSLFTTGYVWLLTAVREDKRRQLLGLIRTEGWQNNRFANLLRDQPTDSDGRRRVSKDKFVEELMFGRSPHSGNRPNSLAGPRAFLSFLGRDDEIDADMAQAVADAVFARAESRGLVKRDPRPSLGDIFIISD